MAHAQKSDFIFRGKGRVQLKSAGESVQETTGSRGVRVSGSNARYIQFRGSVKGTGYPLHSPVSPSLPLPYVTVFHNISTGLYFVVLRLQICRETFRIGKIIYKRGFYLYVMVI